MAFNGNSCVKDPVTGYLTPTHQGALTVFGSDSKVKFIELFKQNGDLGTSCESLGVSYQTMRDHVKADEAFARDMNIALSQMEDKITGVMYRQALTEKGTMDRFGWLRAHNPSKWNPKTQITVNSSEASVNELLSTLKAEGKLIDVDNMLTPESPNQA